jgi:GTP cyclohydrolase IA
MSFQGLLVGSKAVRARIAAENAPFGANANLSEFATPADLEAIQQEVQQAVDALLDALVIDGDHNTKDTARRVAKMYVCEVFSGRYQPPPCLTDFPNASDLDELYTVGPITVRSCCAHHLCPIEGEAWCGVIPSERIIGLSKFARICEWILARPQIQEEAIVQVADLIEGAIKPRGLAVVIKAHHACLSWRGVKDGQTTMASSVTRGLLREDGRARAEFFSLIGSQGFLCR